MLCGRWLQWCRGYQINVDICVQVPNMSWKLSAKVYISLLRLIQGSKFSFRMPTVMPRSYATTEYVHSRVVQYCSQVVDLRWCISIHSCEVCPFQSSDATSPFECQAVHYGLCTPIRRSLLCHPARLQQPQKRKVDIPVRFVQVTHSYYVFEIFFIFY